MRDPLLETDADYETVRGDGQMTLANFIRWERVKLRDAARDAVQLLESAAAPTREYLDFMFQTDVGFREIRARLAKHKERLQALEAIRDAAVLEVD